MPRISKRRLFTFWPLVTLVFLIGVSALISGPMLFLAPDGHLMQWSVEVLKGSPFSNFVIPGIILFVLIGVYPLFVGYGLLTRTAWNGPNVINPFKQFHWAWIASVVVGIIMLIWIGVETLLLGYISFLQPVIMVWGLLILVLPLIPANRQYYSIK